MPVTKGSPMGDGTFRALFDGAINPMLVIDDSRCYVAANGAAARMLQYTREQLVEMRIDDLTPKERRSGLARRWQEFLGRGDACGRVPLVRADGTRIEVDHSSTANVSDGVHLTVFSPEALEPAPPEAGGQVLTTREREVLTAIAAGQKGDEIARHLVIAPDTVRRHVANARQKLEARTRAHAVAEALRRGEIWP
jgi:PAS domain S-box-containing protein